jgi:hypothetical protein
MMIQGTGSADAIYGANLSNSSIFALAGATTRSLPLAVKPGLLRRRDRIVSAATRWAMTWVGEVLGACEVTSATNSR